jgi:ribosomal protein S12 methylthiotransferase
MPKKTDKTAARARVSAAAPEPSPEPQRPETPTVAFISLGCVKNLVDSEKMLGMLAEDGMVPTDEADAADVLVVNTCAFIDESKRESLEAIREAVAWKEAAPGRRVVVAGCLAQRYGKQVADDIPGIDAMLGVFERDKIVDACRQVVTSSQVESSKSAGRKPMIPLPLRSNQEARVAETGDAYGGWKTRSSVLLQQAESHPSSLTTEHQPPATARGRRRDRTATGFWLGGDVNKTGLDMARLRLTPPHFAYLRISEGCDKRCSFCIIPHIRGDLVGKAPGDILAEARELVADGAKELIIVGQNTTSYGKDVGEPDGIAKLLRRLARETDAEQLRLMYVYPANFYTSLIDVMASEPKVLPYVDMPLQHINDRMLKAMRRGVTKNRIEKLVTALREKVPGVVIRTTFIVGFPGETDAEFREMVDFVRTHRFERVGVFTYSPEEGTDAASLPDQIPEDVKQARREELMLAAQEVAFEHVRQTVGRTLDVTIDMRAEEPPAEVVASAGKAKGKAKAVAGKAKAKPETWWVGRYYGQAPEVDSVVYVRDRDGILSPGRRTACRITAGAGYDLIAEPAERE